MKKISKLWLFVAILLAIPSCKKENSVVGVPIKIVEKGEIKSFQIVKFEIIGDTLRKQDYKAKVLNLDLSLIKTGSRELTFLVPDSWQDGTTIRLVITELSTSTYSFKKVATTLLKTPSETVTSTLGSFIQYHAAIVNPTIDKSVVNAMKYLSQLNATDTKNLALFMQNNPTLFAINPNGRIGSTEGTDGISADYPGSLKKFSANILIAGAATVAFIESVAFTPSIIPFTVATGIVAVVSWKKAFEYGRVFQEEKFDEYDAQVSEISAGGRIGNLSSTTAILSFNMDKPKKLKVEAIAGSITQKSRTANKFLDFFAQLDKFNALINKINGYIDKLNSLVGSSMITNLSSLSLGTDPAPANIRMADAKLKSVKITCPSTEVDVSVTYPTANSIEVTFAKSKSNTNPNADVTTFLLFEYIVDGNTIRITQGVTVIPQDPIDTIAGSYKLTKVSGIYQFDYTSTFKSPNEKCVEIESSKPYIIDKISDITSSLTILKYVNTFSFSTYLPEIKCPINIFSDVKFDKTKNEILLSNFISPSNQQGPKITKEGLLKEFTTQFKKECVPSPVNTTSYDNGTANFNVIYSNNKVIVKIILDFKGYYKKESAINLAWFDNLINRNTRKECFDNPKYASSVHLFESGNYHYEIMQEYSK